MQSPMPNLTSRVNVDEVANNGSKSWFHPQRLFSWMKNFGLFQWCTRTKSSSANNCNGSHNHKSKSIELNTFQFHEDGNLISAKETEGMYNDLDKEDDKPLATKSLEEIRILSNLLSRQRKYNQPKMRTIFSFRERVPWRSVISRHDDRRHSQPTYWQRLTMLMRPAYFRRRFIRQMRQHMDNRALTLRVQRRLRQQHIRQSLRNDRLQNPVIMHIPQNHHHQNRNIFTRFARRILNVVRFRGSNQVYPQIQEGQVLAQNPPNIIVVNGIQRARLLSTENPFRNVPLLSPRSIAQGNTLRNRIRILDQATVPFS